MVAILTLLINTLLSLFMLRVRHGIRFRFHLSIGERTRCVKHVDLVIGIGFQ